MPKNQFFYYDHEACTFVEVQPNRARAVVRGAAVAALAVVFAAVGAFGLSQVTTTPAELGAIVAKGIEQTRALVKQHQIPQE